MILQLLTISRNTFTESIRQPIFVILILVATSVLVLNLSLAAYTLDDDNKLLIDMGLSTLFLTGLLLSAFTATGVLTDELENKTILTVVSKPVPRSLFVVGKFLGITAAIALAFWTLALVFLMTVRHRVMQTARDPFDGPVLLFAALAALTALATATTGNYLYRKNFAATLVKQLAALLTAAWALILLINKDWHLQNPATDLDPQTLTGLLLIFQAVTLLTAVAIAVSTCLGRIMTLATCASVLAVGLVSDYLLGAPAQQHLPVRLFYNVIPNLQLLWPADALTQNRPFSARYVTLATGYTTLYTTAVLALAAWLFQRRQVG